MSVWSIYFQCFLACSLKVLERAGICGMRNTLKRAHQVDRQNAENRAARSTREGKLARMKRRAQRAEGEAARSVGEGVTYKSNIGIDTISFMMEGLPSSILYFYYHSILV